MTKGVFKNTSFSYLLKLTHPCKTKRHFKQNVKSKGDMKRKGLIGKRNVLIVFTKAKENGDLISQS